MKLLLDTANLEDIRYFNTYYPIVGVTTNPTILSREGGDVLELLSTIRSIIGKHKELHVQVIETEYEKNTGSVFLGRDYANNDKVYSSEVAVQIDKEVRKIIDEAYERARKVILDNREKVQLIAQTLLIQETLTNEEITSLYKTGYLPGQEPKEEVIEAEVKEANEESNN